MKRTVSMVQACIEQMALTRSDAIQRLNFADANVWLGRPRGFPLAREVPADDIGDLLRAYAIAWGLVSHWQCTTLSAQDANRALEEALPLLPASCGIIWSGLPLIAGEAEPLPALGRMPDRLCGVRVFPKTHMYPLAEWMLGSLCRWLADRRLPLFIWHTELDWSDLRSLARAFPHLSIVVESQPRKLLYHSRPLFTLMAECTNILLEISNFVGQGVMEYAVRHFGPERLVFGTFLPVGDPFVPIGMLLDADIADADKALIAGGNLRRLISEVQR